MWGNLLKKEETIENHFTYFGQTYDETTGLYYLRARYYDPTTGRFTQQDPAEDGYNWYVYGNQNPVIYVDYTGESIGITAGLGALLYELAPYIASVGALIGAAVINMAKGGKQNKRSSEFLDFSDDELDSMYKDPNTSKAQKQKIKTEQKSRKTRHSSQKK